MSLERHVDLRIRVVTPRQHGFGLTAERLARLLDVPVAANPDGTVRRARPSDHVYGRCIDLPSHIAALWADGPHPLSRVARRAERRRVTRQLRQDARERRATAAERRRDRRRLQGDAWLRGGGTITTHPDPTRSTP